MPRATFTANKRRDLYVGTAFIVLASIVYWQVHGLSSQVAMFPKVIAAVIALLGVSLYFEVALAKSKQISLPKVVTKQEIVIVACLLISYILCTTLGFYVAMFLLMMGVFLYLGKTLKFRDVWHGCIFSVAVTVVLYLIFNTLMHVETPSGVLF